MKKILNFLMMLLLTTSFSVSFTACGGDDDEPSDGKIHVINASSQTLNAVINIEASDYNVEDGPTPYSYHLSLEPGEEITYSAPENGIRAIYFSMRVNGKYVYSPEYKTKKITITDKELKKWGAEI